MVAAAKLKRAQDRILSARPYADKMATVIGELSGRVNRDLHPLLNKRPAKRIDIVVITADRGLCGAFNANVLRRAQELILQKEGEGSAVRIVAVGRKSRDFFRRRNREARKNLTNLFDRLSYSHGAEIGSDLVRAYTEKECDEVYLVYNEFVSVIQQRTKADCLLPVEPATGEGGLAGNYLYEPNEAELLAALLPKYIETRVFRALLESAAGELGARMTAMDAATRNAKELIGKLTLIYNKSRQAVITKELMDIVGGSEALKSRV